jgi:predicted transcriptional regulator
MSDAEKLIELTAEIVSSMVGNNNVATADVPVLIKSVHVALSGLGAPAPEPEAEKPKGAVSARASIKADGLISMIDGKKYQTLRRHITRHGYTPESYRETFGLPRDYPMTSSNYSELRRGMAKLIGLGRKSADPSEPVEETEAEAPVSPAAETPEPAPAKGKPGRKPRASKADSAPAEAPAAAAPAEASAPEPAAAEEAPAKPKRGRPRKVQPEAPAPEAAPAAETPDTGGDAPKKRRARK